MKNSTDARFAHKTTMDIEDLKLDFIDAFLTHPEKEDPNNPEIVLKGMWIKRNLILDERLSWIERIAVLVIDHMTEPGRAGAQSERFFMKALGISADEVNRIFTKLNGLGIASIAFDKKPDKRIYSVRIRDGAYSAHTLN